MMLVNSFALQGLEFKKCRKKPVVIKSTQINVPFKVQTLEGIMEGRAGDYLMRGVDGELYPCKKEIYEKTYDTIDEGEA